MKRRRTREEKAGKGREDPKAEKRTKASVAVVAYLTFLAAAAADLRFASTRI